MQKHQIRTEVVSNRKIAPDAFILRTKAEAIARTLYPGQFCNLYIDALDPSLVLPRPFSAYRTDSEKGELEFLCQAVGRGTRRMARLQPGDPIRVSGPFGNGFDLSPSERPLILVAGGVGIAPFFDLILRQPGRTGILLFGGRTRDHLYGLEELMQTGYPLRTATEDGSHGLPGRVTNLLESALREHPGASILACGPTPMLHAVARWSVPRNVPTQLSLEENMACGMGLCRGCAVAVHDKSGGNGFRYAMLCEEGPVLKATELYIQGAVKK
jgi:dihydroorotate dehydrogenase electron transfer subunit